MVDTRSATRLALLLALAAALLALSPLPIASRLEHGAGGMIAPAGSALHDLVQPAADVLLNAGQARRLSEQNAQLRRTVARLEAEAAALREAAVATDDVAALVAAVGEDAARYLPASVLLRDPAPSREAIVIDRGLADGVAAGQPVLGAGGTLVGVVAEAGTHRSTVRLLSDAGSAVTAVIQQSRVPGALAGGPGGLRLEFVPIGAAVAAGDLLLTSALGGQLPGGLPIGRVGAVHSRAQDLFETVEVEPLTDYSRLEHVLILTDFLAGARPDDAATEPAEPAASRAPR